jgi:hypothetical protein
LFDGRHAEDDQQANDADPDLEHRVNLQRVPATRHQPGQEQAAQAHSAHEGAEEYTQRRGRRADHQLQKLQPDDLVNHRRAAAADEQEQQDGQKPTS